MILGFGKGKKDKHDDRGDHDDFDDQPEEEIEYALFQGAVNGQEANLVENAGLAQAGLVPVKELITDALHRRADILRLEPKGKAVVITFSVDGVWYPGGRLAPKAALAIIQMTKLLAGLETRERRKPQSGGIKAELAGTKYVLDVESTPVAGGAERLVVRAHDVNESFDTAESVGFSADLKQKIRDLMMEKSGIVLACGPRHSGTSTTAMGVLRSIDSYMFALYNIVEFPEELSYVTTLERTAEEGLQESIARLIRMEADGVFVDPIRDAQAAMTVFESQSRIKIISEFTARDCAHGIMQLHEWLAQPQLLADGLKGLVSQRLIRLLCDKCKEAFAPNPKLLAKIGLPPETKVLYRTPTMPTDPESGEEEEPEPCRKCDDVGYIGRAGLFEFIEITEGMQDIIRSGPSVPKIRAQAQKERMPSFQSEGLRLVAEGKTSLDELKRIFKKA